MERAQFAGGDLRALPWEARRGALEQLLADARGAPRAVPVLDYDHGVHEGPVADGWEGTIAKQTSSRYRCGRQPKAWVKLKSPAAIARGSELRCGAA